MDEIGNGQVTKQMDGIGSADEMGNGQVTK